MDKLIPDIYNSLQEIAWHFGSHGINGECCYDLSFVEFMALKKLHGNNEFSIHEIGNALNFTKSGATRIINRLENKGYAVRKNSPIDGRICCVSITTKGMEAISRIMENYTAYLEDVLKEFAPQKVEQIRDALEMLVDSVQKNKPFNAVTDTYKGGECC
jgi:DNA-binding MarR family transcriptional regulator